VVDRPVREFSREERAELRTGKTIRLLVNTEGWQLYKKILETHLLGKRNEYEQPAESGFDGIAQVLRAESAKGAIMGLRLALSIPDGILESDKVLRERLGLPRGEEDDE
jgi:hypothetical protein